MQHTVQIPGSLAGKASVSVEEPNLNIYQRCRRLDLEYAIRWNRLKGKDLPQMPLNADKEDLVKFCEVYRVDMNLCGTYVDHHNMIRIQRPPEEMKKETTQAESEKKEDADPLKMNPFVLKSWLKKQGIDVPDDVNKKEDLLKFIPVA